jgi:DNA-binding response OmpR family regulator
MKDGAMQHVLIADAEPTMCEFVRDALEVRGSYRVTAALTALDAELALDRDQPDAAIVEEGLLQEADYRLASRTFDAGIPVLIITNTPQIGRMLKGAGFHCVVKPLTLAVLLDETRALLEKAIERRAELKGLLDQMVKARPALGAAPPRLNGGQKPLPKRP